MSVIELLVWEHKLLRAHLNILEAALSKDNQAWTLLREVSASLAEALGEHHRHEAERAAGRDGQAGTHVAECELMLGIGRFFLEQPTCLADRVRPRLRAFIQALRTGMDRQELEIFPILKAAHFWSLVNRPRGQADAPAGTITLRDALSDALDEWSMGQWLDDGLESRE